MKDSGSSNPFALLFPSCLVLRLPFDEVNDESACSRSVGRSKTLSERSRSEVESSTPSEGTLPNELGLGTPELGAAALSIVYDFPRNNPDVVLVGNPPLLARATVYCFPIGRCVRATIALYTISIPDVVSVPRTNRQVPLLLN